MPSMDYFRRPQLSGKNITRTTNAVLRGSLRRSNADGVSVVPYFPAAVAAQTLNVSIDGTPFVVTLTGNGINTVIADINTAIGVAGTAFDSDGTISIRSATAGTPSSVEVTGGSAATALGFEVTLGGLRVTGGDIPSSPEGRIGNAAGIGFPNSSENLTSESVNRALARVSANSDVLFADLMRHDVVLKPVSFSTSDRRLLTLTASQRVFIGSPGLFTGANPTKEELVPYYQVIDNSNGQPAQSRVVGVVRGSPAGLPPFAAATTWVGGGSSGSVINTSFDKVTAAAITNIANGRIVTCSAANFSDVVVGDFAEITGATNTSPISNNGDKWVVEQVINTTTLALRPLTAAQISGVGATPTTEVQPLVELSSSKTGPESWGSLSIYNGFFTSQAQLIVDPPLPTGGSYTVLCAVPRTFRERQPFDEALNARASMVPLVSDDDLVENWTLSGLVATPSGPNLAVTAGKIRWNGRVYTIPARTFLPGAFTNNTRNYLYWDEATADYAISTSISTFGNVLDSVATTNRGHQIAVVDLSAGAISNIIPNIRNRAEKAIPLTVGEGGQFSSIPAVASYISNISANYPGETATLNGTFPHFEVIIVGNVFGGSSPIPRFTTVGLTIRGINEKATVDLGALVGALEFDVKFLEIRDLKVAPGVGLAGLVSSTGLDSIDRVTLRNLNQGGGSFQSVVINDVFEAPISELIVEGCTLTTRSGISSCVGGAGTGIPNIRVENSTFEYVGGSGVVPRFVYSAVGPNNWNGSSFYMSNCTFTGAWGGTTAWTGSNSFLLASNTASRITIRDVVWANGAIPSTNISYLVNASTAFALISNFRMSSGSIPVALNLGANGIVENSSFTTTTSLNNYAVSANVVRGCSLNQLDIAAAGFSGSGIRTIGDNARIEGNLVSGGYYVGIRNPDLASYIVVANNRINITGLTNSTANAFGGCFAGIQTGDTAVGAQVLSNSITIGTVYGTFHGITPDLGGSGDGLVVTGNQIYLTNPDSTSCTGIGIRLGSSANVTCVGNYIRSTGGTDAVSQDMIGIHMSACTGSVVSSNIVSMESILGTKSWKGIQFGDNENCTVSNNKVHSFGKPVHDNGTSSFGMAWLGNEFVSTTAVAAASLIDRIWGRVEGNRFYWNGTGSAQTLSAKYGPGIVKGNVSEGATFTILASEETIPSVVEGNTSSGVFDVTSTTTATNINFSNNLVTGNSTFTTVVGDIKFSGNNVGGNLSIAGNQIRRLLITASRVVGTTTLEAASTSVITITGSSFDGQFTITSAPSTLISGCSFFSTSTTTIAATLSMSNCQVFGTLSLGGFATQIIDSCRIQGQLLFTADFSNVQVRVSNCTIIPQDQALDAISFPALTFPADVHISVTGNNVVFGTVSAVSPQANCLRFLGNVGRTVINSNRFILAGATAPGSGATAAFSCIRFDGTTANGPAVITGNYLDRRGASFVYGFGTITYWLISAAATSAATQLAGAGNVGISNNAFVAGVGSGGVLLHDSSAAYTL